MGDVLQLETLLRDVPAVLPAAASRGEHEEVIAGFADKRHCTKASDPRSSLRAVYRNMYFSKSVRSIQLRVVCHPRASIRRVTSFSQEEACWIGRGCCFRCCSNPVPS